MSETSFKADNEKGMLSEEGSNMNGNWCLHVEDVVEALLESLFEIGVRVVHSAQEVIDRD